MRHGNMLGFVHQPNNMKCVGCTLGCFIANLSILQQPRQIAHHFQPCVSANLIK